MPLYEYRCNTCGAEFEEIVPSSARDDAQDCPACGREGQARRKPSTFAVAGAHTVGSLGPADTGSAAPGGFS